MRVVHKRCAGLDVHQKSITGLRAGSVEAEGGARDACVRHGHERIAGNVGLAGAVRLHDCSDGSDRSCS